MQQLFGCILTDICVTIAALSLGPKPYDEFPSKMCKILQFLANFLSSLVLLCCHSIFDSYVTYLNLSFNNVDVYFYSHQFFVFIVLNTNYFVEFKFYCKPICLQRKNFLRDSILHSRCLLFCCLCLFLGSRLFFYLIFFPTGFSDIQPGHDKTA